MKVTLRVNCLGTPGVREPLLVEFVSSGGASGGRALDVGAGTGTNAIWLAECGFDVFGIDISQLAVEKAHAKLEGWRLPCQFSATDSLAKPPDRPFRADRIAYVTTMWVT